MFYDICLYCLGTRTHDILHIGSENEYSIISCNVCGSWWHENCLSAQKKVDVMENQIFCYKCKSCSSIPCLQENSHVYLLKCGTCGKCSHFDCIRRVPTFRREGSKRDVHQDRKLWQCSTCKKKKKIEINSPSYECKTDSLLKTTNVKKRKLDQIPLFMDESEKIFKKIKKNITPHLTDLIGFPQVSSMKFYDNDVNLFLLPNSEHPEAIICEFCLNLKKKTNKGHVCSLRHPPGNEIYRRGELSVFEVDGDTNPSYCRRLCLLGKYFIHEKAIYWDVNTFYFYILFEGDALSQSQFRGFFSKEKGNGPHNLGAIVVLPPFQNRGFGKLLIDLSYSLSRMEGLLGTPERPFSKLGERTYHGYWTLALFRYFSLHSSNGTFTLNEISRNTGITVDDIIMTFQRLKMIQFSRSDESTNPTLILEWSTIKLMAKNFEKLRIHDRRLCWLQ